MSDVFTEGEISDVTDTKVLRRKLNRCQSHPNQGKKKKNVVDIAKLTRRLSQQRFAFSPKPNIVGSVWQGFEKVDSAALNRRLEHSCSKTSSYAQNGRIRVIHSACGRRSRNELPTRPASTLGLLRQGDSASVSTAPHTAMSVREYENVRIRLSPAPSICGQSEISDSGTIFSSCARESIYSDKTFGTSLFSEKSFRKKSTSSGVSVASSADTEFMPRRYSSRRRLHSRQRQSLAGRPYQMIRELENMTEEQRARRKAMAKTRMIDLLHLVRWVVRLATSMKSLSMGRVERNLISDFYYYRTNGYRDQKEVSLVFDKAKYSTKYQEQLPMHIQQIAWKPPEIRTEDDIHKLMTVMNRIKSFEEKYTLEMKTQICRAARYCICEKDRVVLREGHVGHCFYFLYSGCCVVQRMHTDPDTNTTKLMHENTIERGASFGELALLGDGQRTATVICCTQTELFQLDKSTFFEICPGIFEKELDDKLQITRNQDLFNRFIPAKLARTLCFNSQLVDYPIGRVVEKDWCDSANLYFVCTGRVVLYHKVDLRIAAKKRNGRKMERISVNANMKKPLPWPSDLIGNENIRFAAIGMLEKGDHSCHQLPPGVTLLTKPIGGIGETVPNDLRILKERLAKDMSSVVMISEGATVLKIPVSTFQLTVPIPVVDQYFRETTDIKPDLPATETICRRLLDNINWQGYRAKIVSTLRQEQKGAAMSHMPATKKGSSGWSKWPGFELTPKRSLSKLNSVDSSGERTIELRQNSEPEVASEVREENECEFYEEGERIETDDTSVADDWTDPGRRDSQMPLGNLESLDGELNLDDAISEETIVSDRSESNHSTMSATSTVSDSIAGSEGNIIDEVKNANVTQVFDQVGRYSRVAGEILKDLDILTGYRSGTDSRRHSRTRNSLDWGFADDSKWIGSRGDRFVDDDEDSTRPRFQGLLEEEITDGELKDQATEMYSPRSTSPYKQTKSVSWSDL